jgi:zinc/manganese transport system substrate-binding protein/manganese/iron transport system substrate-binding protein
MFTLVDLKLLRLLAPLALLVFVITVSACGGAEPDQEGALNDSRIEVVATTSIVGDVVNHIGGERIVLTVLMPPSVDPHSYEVTPQDAVAIEEADVVFINGLGLEKLLEPILSPARADSKVVSVSDGVPKLVHEDAEHGSDEDPHVWFDPTRVMIWVRNIEQTLTRIDPEGSDYYVKNATAYNQQLEELDQWIADEFANVPPGKRRIVTDHDSFGYLVDRYKLELVGTVIPGYNSLAEPSARDLAKLINAIEEYSVSVVFVSDSVSPDISEQIALETGIQLVPLSTGALSASEGDAPTYLEFMRSNISKITQALTGDN